jgi:hypothetical protein
LRLKSRLFIRAHSHRTIEKEDQALFDWIDKARTFYGDLLKVLEERKPLVSQLAHAVKWKEQFKDDDSKLQKRNSAERLSKLSASINTNIQQESRIVDSLLDCLMEIDVRNFAIAVKAVKDPYEILSKLLKVLKTLLKKPIDPQLKKEITLLRFRIEGGYLSILERIKDRFIELKRHNLRAVAKDKSRIANHTILTPQETLLHERRRIHDRRLAAIAAEQVQKALALSVTKIKSLTNSYKTSTTGQQLDQQTSQLLMSIEHFSTNFTSLAQYILTEEQIATKVTEFNAAFARKLQVMVKERDSILETAARHSKEAKALLRAYSRNMDNLVDAIKKEEKQAYRGVAVAVRGLKSQVALMLGALALMGALTSGCQDVKNVANNLGNAMTEQLGQPASRGSSRGAGALNPEQRAMRTKLNEAQDFFKEFAQEYDNLIRNRLTGYKEIIDNSKKKEDQTVLDEADKFIEESLKEFNWIGKRNTIIDLIKNISPKASKESALKEKLIKPDDKTLNNWIKSQFILELQAKAEKIDNKKTKKHLEERIKALLDSLEDSTESSFISAIRGKAKEAPISKRVEDLLKKYGIKRKILSKLQVDKTINEKYREFLKEAAKIRKTAKEFRRKNKSVAENTIYRGQFKGAELVAKKSGSKSTITITQKDSRNRIKLRITITDKRAKVATHNIEEWMFEFYDAGRPTGKVTYHAGSMRSRSERKSTGNGEVAITFIQIDQNGKRSKPFISDTDDSEIKPAQDLHDNFLNWIDHYNLWFKAKK